MEPYSYKVMGYAESDLDTDGIPFALVLYVPSSMRVVGYVRSDWQSAIGQAVSADRLMIEGFLEDLQHCSRNTGTSASEFFDCLKNLGVGAVRTLSSGQCIEGSKPIHMGWDQPVNRLPDEEFTRFVGQIEEACLPLDEVVMRHST